MHKLNTAVLTVTVMLLAVSNVATAESWICEHGNLVREIVVELETVDPAPCSVVYNKEAEGLGSKVLWTAKTDGAYCKEKADGLAEKLKGFGWACTTF